MSLFAFDDAACLRLADQHGTPCFAYHGPAVESQYSRLRAALPGRTRIAYAVKANPHPQLLGRLAALGAAFDCASIGELQRLADLQISTRRIFYAGPGKRDTELQAALRMGVRIQAEGWEDLVRIEIFSAGPVDVNLRVHPSRGVQESNPIIGGVGPSAFGVDEEQLPEILGRAKALGQVRIRGLHVFAASNERDASRLLATHAMVLELGRELQQRHSLDLCQIDVGGGLGVPYAPDQVPLDVGALGAGLRDLLAEHTWFKGELVLEPGRFLAAPSGVYLARVIRIKESRGTCFAILEGGVNHLLRPLLTGEAFPVRAVGKSGATTKTTLAGPLCTSLDRLGEVDLPNLAPGDLLTFGTTGAYGFTEGMTHFLSHPVPKEIWVEA
jgi:diaminopimelate decarboxylase